MHEFVLFEGSYSQWAKLRRTFLLSNKQALRPDQCHQRHSCKPGHDMYKVGCLIACCSRGDPEQHDYSVVSAECHYDPIYIYVCCLKVFVLFHRFVVSFRAKNTCED